MTGGSNTLHFFYDAQNKPAVVLFNGTAYAYLYNQQDDVIGLVDSNGTQMVSYSYDAWGKPISKTGTLATTLGKLNPFRYRGYIFDEKLACTICVAGTTTRIYAVSSMQTMWKLWVLMVTSTAISSSSTV